jgi:hypothetical protein
MAENLYILRCDYCDFKRFSNGSEESIQDLREVVLCSHCSGPKRFKCPKCGYVIRSKKYKEPPDPTTRLFGDKY